MILLEMTFSLLSTWTLVAIANWVRKLDVRRVKGLLGSTNQWKQMNPDFNSDLTDKTPQSIESMSKGYVVLEYLGIESQPRSYYNLFSEDDPNCYSISDLDEFSDSILADLEEIEQDISRLDAQRNNLPLACNQSQSDYHDSC